jgi:hypothetical protein
MIRIAIPGFGRMGRSLMKAALKLDLFVPGSISQHAMKPARGRSLLGSLGLQLGCSQNVGAAS